MTVTGTVISSAVSEGFDGPVLLTYIKDIEADDIDGEYRDKKMRIFLPPDSDIRPGQRIRVKGKVYLYEKATNPGQFDAFGFYKNRGILCDIRDAELKAAGREYSKTAWFMQKVRNRSEDILNTYLEAEDAAIIKAMLFGNKNEIEDEIKELFRRNGIAHILAISGLHISFLAMLLYRLFTAAGLSVKIRAAVSETAIILYGIMVGFSASSFRAICMFTIFLLSKVFKRTYDMLTAMSFALTLVSLTTPKLLKDSGLALSYLAVLGVGYFNAVYAKNEDEKAAGENIKTGTVGRIGGLISSLKQAVSISLFVFLATLPEILMMYGEAAFYSIILNLVIIPLMSVLLMASISLVIAGYVGFGYVAVLSTIPIKVILGLYKNVCKVLTVHNVGRINIGSPALWQTAFFYILLVAAVNLKGRYRKTGAIFMMLTAVLLLFVHPLKGMDIRMVDIGQGDCMVIRTSDGPFRGTNTYIIDCGSSSKKEPGTRRLIPMLKHFGTHRVDGVFITHPDSDHVNGIEELLNGAREENLKIGRIYMYEGFVSSGELPDVFGRYDITGLRAGMCLSDGRLKFKVLFPYGGYPVTDPNAASLMMDVEYGDFHMLTTGDAGIEGERYITETMRADYDGECQDYSVLKAGHHGSDTSSGEEFLRMTDPEIALISCGRNNSYGHPHKETTDRLKSIGSRIYRTDESGCISIRTDGRSILVDTFVSEGP